MKKISRRGFIEKGAITTLGMSALPISFIDGIEMHEMTEIGRVGAGGLEQTWKKNFFPSDLPEREWVQFLAEGFREPVSGVIYRTGGPPCCGVALGGIGTGCIDIDARGVYGFSSIFNPLSHVGTYSKEYSGRDAIPRELPVSEPILGLAVDKKTWVLASKEFISGGDISWCAEPQNSRDPDREPPQDFVKCPKIDGVSPAKEIHYWGHYPVADLEFETDAPISVGMRAWSPFLPGDVGASNIPASVFEVHLRNTSDGIKEGTLAFNFPGQENGKSVSGESVRQKIEEDFEGVMVSTGADTNYLLGLLDKEKARFGSRLKSADWCKIPTQLPQPSWRDYNGLRLYHDSGISAAVDFTLKPEEKKIIRFLVTWYAPVWEGAVKKSTSHVTDRKGYPEMKWMGSEWDDTNYYTGMYATRYGSSLDVARRMALEHKELLKRIISWQSVVYTEGALPVWLRDSLINILYLIAEDSYWAQSRPPLGDWCYPGGLFVLNESPRGCSHMGCIPCDWYGTQPIVYFFPELARSTLKAYKQYQRGDGAVPFELDSIGSPPDLATPGYPWQISLNGTVYIDLVDRLWQRTGDDEVLKEFYESAKKCNTFTINLRTGPGGVISMPEGNQGMEWFESGDWAGMCAHLGGLRLAQLCIMERMAIHMKDDEYAKECRAWYKEGSAAMEKEMWTGSYYLNFYEKETGKKSDVVMAYQLDGQWAAAYHELPGVFDPDRVKTALQTIKKYNVALTPEVGAANFASPDGSLLKPDDKIVAYGAYSMFPPELLVLAMTYIYSGQSEFGLDLAKRHWENIVLKQCHPWDAPNIVRGDTGKRTFGTDYYQNMMLWSLPAAMEKTGIKGFCATGGLVDRIIQAGKVT